MNHTYIVAQALEFDAKANELFILHKDCGGGLARVVGPFRQGSAPTLECRSCDHQIYLGGGTPRLLTALLAAARGKSGTCQIPGGGEVTFAPLDRHHHTEELLDEIRRLRHELARVLGACKAFADEVYAARVESGSGRVKAAREAFEEAVYINR